MDFKTELFTHQKNAVEKLRGIKVGALYMEQGTGKTRTALELINMRLEKNKVDKVLWLCPCSVIVNLYRDIMYHTGEFPDIITICGIESLSSSDKLNAALRHLVANDRYYLIVDESLLVKNYFSKRTQNVLELSKKCEYKLILNGTPISRSEGDLYAQCAILSKAILGYNSYWAFEANHLELDPRFPNKVVRALNVDYLTSKIGLYSYQIKKSECLNLPPKTYDHMFFSLTPEQYEHYSLISNELLFEVDEMEPETIYRLFAALQNITSGLRINLASKKHFTTKPFFEDPLKNPRIDCLLYVIDKIEDEKVIIYCQYTHEIDNICAALEKEYGNESAVRFDGTIPMKKRNENIQIFRKKSRFLVANKNCAKFGLNLQFCSYIIYYNNDWDYATRVQSEDRVHRIGQNSNVHILDICALDTLDERILACLDRKERLLHEFKQNLNDKKSLKEWLKGGKNSNAVYSLPELEDN